MAIKKNPKSRGINPPASAHFNTPSQSSGLPDIGLPKPQPLNSYFSINKPSLTDAEKGNVDTMLHQYPGMPQSPPPSNGPIARLLPPVKELCKHRDKDYTYVTYDNGSSKIFDNSNGKNISHYEWWTRNKAKALKEKRKAQASRQNTNAPQSAPEQLVNASTPYVVGNQGQAIPNINATRQTLPNAFFTYAGESDYDKDSDPNNPNTGGIIASSRRLLPSGITEAHSVKNPKVPLYYGGEADKKTGLYGNRLPTSDPRVADAYGANPTSAL